MMTTAASKGRFVLRGNVLPGVEATTTAMPEKSVSSSVACRAIVGSMTTALKVRFAAAIAAATPAGKMLTAVTGASVREVPVELAVVLMTLAASVKSASKMTACWAAEPMEIAVRGRFASNCHVAGVALTTISALGMNCVSITIAGKAAERMRTVGADKFVSRRHVSVSVALMTVAVMVPSARSNRDKTWEFVSQDVGTMERAAAMPIAVKRGNAHQVAEVMPAAMRARFALRRLVFLVAMKITDFAVPEGRFATEKALHVSIV